MPNQWKPTPPLEIIEPHIQRFWAARLNDCQIVEELRKVIDSDNYGIGLTKFVEIRKALGLTRARQQAHTPTSIHEAMVALREVYPNAGAREMVSLLFHEHGLSVARRVVHEYFTLYEPHLIRQRKANRLRCRRFWAAGVNDIWSVDQHDKWLRFGLALHIGIKPFSGHILWLKVWHSNRNPQLILSYYLETVKTFGFMPLVTQSDPGTENVGIANAQTMLRQMHDPSLAGFIQHRWMRTKKNIMPEIVWSQFRRRFAPGFESILEVGVQAGWYATNNTLQLMVFRWVFIPWLQGELNGYMHRVNNTRKRRDRNKILPHGIPELIHTSPENYNALNFRVTVEKSATTHIREVYINPNHIVFDLVPPSLGECIMECYNELHRPPITRDSAWTVYLDLLGMLQARADIPVILSSVSVPEEEEELQLMDGLRDLPTNEDSEYMGGVGNGLGLQTEHHRALDELEEDEHIPPSIEDMDEPELDVEVLLIDGFSDEEDGNGWGI